MDWPVIGAVSAVVIVGSVVTYQAANLLGASTTPVKAPHLLASYGSSVDRSAYDIPGFAGNGTGERPLSFPLIRLIDPDGQSNADHPAPGNAARLSTTATPKKAAAEHTAKPATSKDVKLANLTPSDSAVAPAQPRAEQWRVVPTANAAYSNLGGHLDRTGVLDGLASGYLRDALKQHSKFAQLPPDIRNHILTQNINLAQIAPYRGLLGIDDATMEREQAVKFERLH